MKVLSFDVGIKNLAYCCIESGSESNQQNITSEYKRIFAWNIINLIPENPHCYISSCKKPAIQTCMYHGHAVNWCTKHNNIYTTLSKTANKENGELTKPTNVHIVNCKTIETDDLRKSIIYNLDMHILPIIFKYKIDYVLIENQPVKKNPLMKQVMDTLYCWFLIRCICDRQIIKKIHLISPSNKLRQYAEQLNTYEDNSKEKYKATKNMSVDVVQEYLKKNNLKFLINYLEKYPKKDDLCDSLLQGFYWIDKMNDEDNKKQKKARAKAEVAVKSNKKKEKAKVEVVDLNINSDIKPDINTNIKPKKKAKVKDLDLTPDTNPDTNTDTNTDKRITKSRQSKKQIILTV